MPLRRRADLRADPHDAHPRHASRSRARASASSIGKFGPEPVRGPHHRHLALPARPGQVRHDRAVPQRPAGLERAALPPPEPHPGARGDRGRRRLPRAGAPHRRRDDRRHPGPGRRGAPQHGHPDGPGRGREVVATRGARPRLLRRGPRPHLGGPQGVRVASASARRTRRPSPCPPTSRRGSRPTTPRPSSPASSPTTPACTPSGSSSTTPASFGIPVLGLDVNASQRDLPSSSGSDDAGCRDGGDAGCDRIVGDPTRMPRCRPGDARASPTASGSRSPTSRGSARPRSPGSSPASPSRASPTSGPGPGSPAGHRAAGPRGRVRHGLRHRHDRCRRRSGARPPAAAPGGSSGTRPGGRRPRRSRLRLSRLADGESGTTATTATQRRGRQRRRTPVRYGRRAGRRRRRLR